MSTNVIENETQIVKNKLQQIFYMMKSPKRNLHILLFWTCFTSYLALAFIYITPGRQSIMTQIRHMRLFTFDHCPLFTQARVNAKGWWGLEFNGQFWRGWHSTCFLFSCLFTGQLSSSLQANSRRKVSMQAQILLSSCTSPCMHIKRYISSQISLFTKPVSIVFSTEPISNFEKNYFPLYESIFLPINSIWIRKSLIHQVQSHH